MNSQTAKAYSRQPGAMRERLLDSAVELLIKEGVASTTTSAVQKKANVSRGALLHHFPTRAELLASTVERLVKQNELQINESLAALAQPHTDVEHALVILSDNMTKPSYRAEMELWVLSRHDQTLRQALYKAEKAARSDLDRVIGTLLVGWKDSDNYSLLADMTVEFMRGLTFSDILRDRPEYRYKMIALWTDLIRKFIES